MEQQHIVGRECQTHIKPAVACIWLLLKASASRALEVAVGAGDVLAQAEVRGGELRLPPLGRPQLPLQQHHPHDDREHAQRELRHLPDHVPLQPGAERRPFDVVGPVCETGDTFARAWPLPPLGEGALVAFRSAGAYGAVMASEYNARPLVPEVLVQGDQFGVIRARPSYDEMIARDSVPPWL